MGSSYMSDSESNDSDDSSSLNDDSLTPNPYPSDSPSSFPYFSSLPSFDPIEATYEFDESSIVSHDRFYPDVKVVDMIEQLLWSDKFELSSCNHCVPFRIGLTQPSPSYPHAMESFANFDSKSLVASEISTFVSLRKAYSHAHTQCTMFNFPQSSSSIEFEAFSDFASAPPPRPPPPPPPSPLPTSRTLKFCRYSPPPPAPPNPLFFTPPYLSHQIFSHQDSIPKSFSKCSSCTTESSKNEGSMERVFLSKSPIALALDFESQGIHLVSKSSIQLSPSFSTPASSFSTTLGTQGENTMKEDHDLSCPNVDDEMKDELNSVDLEEDKFEDASQSIMMTNNIQEESDKEEWEILTSEE